MPNITKLTLDLLNYCRRIGEWEPDETDRPIQNLLTGLSESPEYQQFFTLDTAYGLVLLELGKENLQVKEKFDNNDAELFLTNIRDGLSANAANHWIVIPLRRATLTHTIRFRNFVFIAGDRSQKIEVLRRLNRISKVKAEFRASHTERTRSPGFFEYPLLAIRIKHQTGFVEAISNKYALWSICALQAIYWAYIYPNSEIPFFIEPHGRSGHLAVYATDDWRYGHRPLHFKSECRFKLDWLASPEHQKRFTAIYKNIIVNSNRDSLSFRFFRALRYFGKAIDTETSREIFEGMGMSLLYLLIAAEGILLSQDFEKRSRLTVLLPALTKVSNTEQKECARALDNIYRYRSDFVHDGSDIYPDWDEDLKSGEKTNQIRLVKRMVAKLLADSPKHIDSVFRKVNKDLTKIEGEWFKALREKWDQKIGLT